MTECRTPEVRLVANDPSALDALRRDVLDAVGPVHGAGILYAVGYAEGLTAALAQLQLLGALEPGARSWPEPPSALLFSPAAGSLPSGFWGRLPSSIEACQTSQCAQTGCLVTAGYAAGWYSELLGQTILVREHECRARGARECRFEARPLGAWAAADPFISELLPYLDFDTLRRGARDALTANLSASEEGDEESTGFLLGPFDPTSPAVHVWGPLMVMPYAGGADAEESLHTVLDDEDGNEIRSAVVDLTGARIEALELPGLLLLLRRLRSRGIECILVGLSAPQKRALCTGPLFSEALFERDLTRAIALGFQLAQQLRAA